LSAKGNPYNDTPSSTLQRNCTFFSAPLQLDSLLHTHTVTMSSDMLPRELMMMKFNRDLTFRAHANMLNRTTKGVGTHKCWIFSGALTTADTTRGPKPRQSVQYRLYKKQQTPLPKKALDGHILALIHTRMQLGLDPWARGDTVSHLCHVGRCVRPKHLRIESMYINNERNICKRLGRCGNRHHGYPPCLL